MMSQSIKLSLSFLERKILADLLPELSSKLKLEIKSGRVLEFTQDEAQAILQATNIDHGQSMNFKVRAMEHITDLMSKAIDDSQGIGAIPVGERLYQFKVSLRVLRPLIWRRFQVRECTLDKLHEHIQTAMGWKNCHLHQFKINGETYGDPQLLDDGFEDSKPFIDSTTLKLIQVVPKSGQPMTLDYEYDFGDCWMHEVVFEGCLRLQRGTRYPICLEGERACPPEDSGGAYQYGSYVEALFDPAHEEHAQMLEWRGKHDPTQFDCEKTMRRMQRGLPNWRNRKQEG